MVKKITIINYLPRKGLMRVGEEISTNTFIAGLAVLLIFYVSVIVVLELYEYMFKK